MSAALFGEEILLFGYQKIRLFVRSHARNCRSVGGARWFRIGGDETIIGVDRNGGPPRTPKQQPPVACATHPSGPNTALWVWIVPKLPPETEVVLPKG